VNCPTCRAWLDNFVPTAGTVQPAPAIGSMVICSACFDLVAVTAGGPQLVVVETLPPIEQVRVAIAREALRQLMRHYPPRAQA
jgi:hypothetical protein